MANGQNNAGWNTDTSSTPSEADVLKNAKDAAAQPTAEASSGYKFGDPGYDNSGNTYNGGGSNYCGSSIDPQLPKLVTMLSMLETQPSLSEKGSEYLKNLRAALEDRSSKIPLKTLRLTNPSESYLIYSEQYKVGLVLVFFEANLDITDNDDAIIGLYGRARNNAAMTMAHLPEFRVLNVIGIGPEDYEKCNVMITDIKNTMIAESDPQFQNMTVATIKNLRLQINPNLERIKAFIRQVSPHGVPAAYDFGFTIDIMVPRQRQDYFVTSLNNNHHQDYELRTIAAIVAKNRFLCNSNGGMGIGMMGNMFANQQIFLPNVIITDIVSTMKTPDLIPVYLMLAQEAFLGCGLWKTPYKQFGVKGGVNIGNLLENSVDHRLLECTNDMDVENFIATYCKAPILTLGATEGRSRMPGLEWFSDRDMYKHAINAFNSFLDNPIIKDDPVIMRIPEYTGTCTIKGELCDSRYVDYLHVVAENPNEAPNLRPLQMLSNNPQDRVKIIKSLCPDYVTKYVTMNCALRYDVLSAIAPIVSKNIQVKLDGQSNSGSYIGLDTLVSESKKFANGIGGFMGGSVANNVNFSSFFGYTR